MAALFPPPAPLPLFRRSTLHTATVACVFVAAAIVLSGVLPGSLSQATYGMLLVFLSAVTAWYGGLWPGGASALFGAAAAWYWIIPPERAIKVPDLDHLVQLGLSILTSLGTVAISASYRRQLEAASANLVRAETEANESRFESAHLGLALQRAENVCRELTQDLADVRARLESTEDRMKVAQQTSGFLLFDFDHRTRALEMVGDSKSLLGVDLGQTLTIAGLLEFVHEPDRQRVATDLERAVANKSPIDTEFRLLRSGDGVTWTGIKASTSYDLFDNPVRTVAVLQNVDAKKRTEQALLQTEKLAAASRLAASIAHEVNNPLTAATNLLYIIRDDPSLSQAGKQYAGMAEEELRRLSNITRQSLGFYREHSDPTEINLPDLLDDVVAAFARNITAGINIERQYQASPPVVAVKGELRQVFSNLVSNAVQALNDSGTIRIAVHPEARQSRSGALVIVADNGPGIPSKLLQPIFEPFFTTQKERGTGLGLWLAKQLVERNGGTIQVRSSVTDLEHGTRFEVFIPGQDEHATASRGDIRDVTAPTTPEPTSRIM